MENCLRVLLVEDNPGDAELVMSRLQAEGFALDWRRVETQEEYLASLRPDLDLILADYTLPQFSASAALRLARDRYPEIPFIVVSGTIGEEAAVAALKEGADDYLLKDRLQRLGEAVRKEVRARALQREFGESQRALRDSEQRYRLMFELNPHPMWVFDTESYRFLAVNNAAIERYGYARDEFLALTVFDVHRPSDRARLSEALDGRLRRFDRLGEFQHQRRDGSLIDVEVTSHEIVFDGRPARVVLASDVTDRRRAEEALLKHQQRTQFALKTGGIGIWDWDARSDRVHWSETLEKIHGLAAFSFEGTMQAFYAVVHEEDRAAMRAEFERALHERRDVSFEYRTVLQDGATRRISVKGRFFRDDSGRAVSGVGIGVDVTERRGLESQLIQAQKMEAIGQLAGGIAHDFNNLLTAILGYTELLAPVLGNREQHRKDLEQIRKAAMRATRLTRQLLAFSRRQILQPAVIDMNALVSDVSILLGRLIGENITLKLDLDPGIWRTKADPGQIEQVIVNLAINARDAMPAGGTLTLQTANAEVDDLFFRRHGFANETGATRFVVLSVTDTGCGMEPSVKKRIFEPFFTTKPKGKGTGLGLATVYGIVKQSGGSIWVYSEPGQGSTFKIYLPRTDQPVTAEPPSPAQQAPRGTETILLVEDEDAVRMLSRVLLERCGYRVVEAADADQAIRLVDGGQFAIDLLVTDVVMPGLSGPELYQQLTRRLDGLQVLYLSGYTDEAMVKRGVLTPGTAFLQKPFTAVALSAKVRELLDSKMPSVGHP